MKRLPNNEAVLFGLERTSFVPAHSVFHHRVDTHPYETHPCLCNYDYNAAYDMYSRVW
jgi:hypothetical protein